MEKKKTTTREQGVSAPKPPPFSIDLKKHESECRRIEELLRDVQRQQRAILNNIPDMAWLKDKESRFIAVNESFAKACGLKPENIIGKTDLDVWPHDLAKRYRADDQEVMESGGRKCVEEPLDDKEGKIKWIETIKTPIYNTKGEVIGTTGIARDITERKKLEDRLREAKAELEIRVRIRTAELSKANEDLRKYVSELRQTEEMLKANESRYRAIVEDQTELVCRFLPDGTLTFVNESYCKYFGRSREELLGKNFLPLISEEDREMVKNNLASLNKKKPIISNEERVVLPDGKVRWQLWNNQMLFDDEGHFLEIQAVGRDITERKNFERALQESELQYRTTIESMSQAIHVVDKDLKIVIVNEVFKKWSEALGLNNNILGKNIFEAFPFLSEKVKDEYAQVFQAGKTLITEEYNQITGKDIITETRKIPIFEEGKVTRVVTVVDDITERKHWEQVLRESEERYKRIVDTVTDYIFTVYLEENKPIKTIYGPTCLSVTGYSPQELQADAYLWINMVHKDDRKEVQDYTRKILSGRENLFIEHRIVRKDGAIRWVRNTSVLHFDSAGKISSYDGIIQDITERKSMETRISRINECFLSFGTDPLLNVNMLVSLCGELLGADCALYNRIEGSFLCTIGQWNVPPDFNPKDRPEGHICFDVIKKNEDEILIVHNLKDSLYAKSDPNVTKYNLDTYLGYPVRISGETIGSLCAVYQRDFSPSTEDKKIIGIIASAIGVEEERRKTGEILRQRVEFEKIITSISANFIKIRPENMDREVNQALEMIGRFTAVDRSYIFLVNDEQSRATNAYEWCSEGVKPLKEGLQDVPVDKFPWFTKKIKNLENIYIPRLKDFPEEAAAEKEFISNQGLQSIMIVPMVYGNRPIGFIGLDSAQEKEWSEDDILLLRTIGEIFTNALEHKKAEEAIMSGERFLSSIFNSIQDGISILDRELNIVRVNPTMEKWYKHYMPLEGKKCFHAYHGRKEPCKICPSRITIETGVACYEVVPRTGVGGEIVGWLDLYSFPLIDPL
ncbi:MAG: PAS domain S-box protein, partial [Candidatus Omnitrophica bacterium]|nr:PAS domain S-box protein [Candidatus Omnitrophota bacterium]